jgi:hypothetical protein
MQGRAFHLSASLRLPALSVHPDHEEPEHRQSFSQKAGHHVVRGQVVGERDGQICEPGEAADGHQHAEDSRQEGRPENEITDEKTIVKGGVKPGHWGGAILGQ